MIYRQDLLFLVICTLIFSPELSSMSLAKQMQYFGFYMFLVYFTSSMILFGSFGWIAYTMLNILAKQIQSDDDDERDDKLIHWQTDLWRRRLAAWKAQYYWIGEYVQSMNNCLGPLLLLVVATYFVRMVNNSFKLMNSLKMPNNFQEFDSFQYAIHLAKDFVYFSAFVYLPRLVSQEVI